MLTPLSPTGHSPPPDDDASSSTDSSTDSFMERFTDNLTDNLTDIMTDIMTDNLTDIMTDIVTDIMTDNLTDSLTETLTANLTKTLRGSLKAERENIPGCPNTEELFNIPVVLSLCEAEEPHTVQVNIRANDPLTYNGLVQKILSASNRIFQSYYEAYGEPVQQKRDIAKILLSPGSVYFRWNFSSHTRFTEDGRTIPGWAKTDAVYLSPEELTEYIRTAHTGRTKHIFVRLKLEWKNAKEIHSEKPGHFRQEGKEARGPDSKSPGTFSEKGSRQVTLSQQQRPLSRQASQETSSQIETNMNDKFIFRMAVLLSLFLAFCMIWALLLFYVLGTAEQPHAENMSPGLQAHLGPFSVNHKGRKSCQCDFDW
ncbi:hypothetical protein F5Y01DRAFT_315072 [Xylaria sp. FL0043]|nr:hypothetical protein F5Y01DRAFT_315072 [Xylaria sp. FL0043]